MSPTTTPAPFVAPADSVCVLCASGTQNILGGQTFQTYSPDGAKKAATKLENVHKENNVKLAAILAVAPEARTDEQKLFLKEYGETPKPESLEIRILAGIEFDKNVVPRNLPKPVVALTPEQKAEKAAKLRAQLAALEA